jgi:hypothetical protein
MKEIEIKTHVLEDFISETAAAIVSGAVLKSSMHTAGFYFATLLVEAVVDRVVDILDGDDVVPAKKPAKVKLAKTEVAA